MELAARPTIPMDASDINIIPAVMRILNAILRVGEQRAHHYFSARHTLDTVTSMQDFCPKKRSLNAAWAICLSSGVSKPILTWFTSFFQVFDTRSCLWHGLWSPYDTQLQDLFTCHAHACLYSGLKHIIPTTWYRVMECRHDYNIGLHLSAVVSRMEWLHPFTLGFIRSSCS